jgi:hypothetical protein
VDAQEATTTLKREEPHIADGQAPLEPFGFGMYVLA